MNARAYYNEDDEFAAQWLRNLIAAGLIAPGVVDTRSIVDVCADDLDGFTQCHFFAGIGGWSYALRLAGWPDDRPVWTGSCPCQPFSVAGKRGGFDDARHLWPVWFDLIRQRRPATIFGEQVASATEWLRLVRSDLEAVDYAVGAMPIQAASAGADHLRDRYWFVGSLEHAARERGHRSESSAGPHGRPGAENSSRTGVGQADADDSRSQGRIAESECPDQRLVGPDGVADAANRNDGKCSSEPHQRQESEFGISGVRIDLADTGSGRCGRPSEGQIQQPRRAETVGASDPFEWVIGADGKARRVKSGLRLLAHGIPGRVGKLRGFGNAIDPRPAAEFIGAYLDCTTAVLANASS